MLDSPEGVCAGQTRFEYPATSVLFSITGAIKWGDAIFALAQVTRPVGTLFGRPRSTAAWRRGSNPPFRVTALRFGVQIAAGSPAGWHVTSGGLSPIHPRPCGSSSGALFLR